MKGLGIRFQGLNAAEIMEHLEISIMPEMPMIRSKSTMVGKATQSR
jgi:hypothetical protein